MAASSVKAQASAAIDAAHAKILSLLPEGVALPPITQQQPRSTLQLLFNPDLPPYLAPVPGVCRFLAASMILPVLLLCLTDLAGYAIFRTLGFRRRRVRVKRSSSDAAPGTGGVQSEASAAFAAKVNALPGGGGLESPTNVRAPLLTPGAYDADTLLRYRARSISGDSVEAEEEWVRTGGKFARVSTVRANQQAASGKPSESSQPSSSKGVTRFNNDTSHSDSSQRLYARASGVGVEGALGYSDTDADDSGPESGRNSPEIGRRRQGLGNSGFNFTPVEGGKDRLHVDLKTQSSSGSSAVTGLGVEGMSSTSASSDSANRSPNTMDSVTSSWIGVEDPMTAEGAAATAADLETTTSS